MPYMIVKGTGIQKCLNFDINRAYTKILYNLYFKGHQIPSDGLLAVVFVTINLEFRI